MLQQASPSEKTGRSGDIHIPTFVNIPKYALGKDQSDHRTSNHVHSNLVNVSTCFDFVTK